MSISRNSKRYEKTYVNERPSDFSFFLKIPDFPEFPVLNGRFVELTTSGDSPLLAGWGGFFYLSGPKTLK
jgi:hypothetical protein